MWLFDEIARFLAALDLSPGAIFTIAFMAWFLLGAVLSALIGGLVRLIFEHVQAHA